MSSLVFNAGVVGDWFKNLWISLWLMIDNVIYVFINWMYRVFILVAKVDIFGGGDQIKAITQRLYLIVGIAMLFIFAYNLILLIVNPEGKQIGNMGKVVQNALISIILVTLLPTIFSYLTTIQAHIIDSNVIGHIILGTSSTDIDTTNKKAGVDTALTIFSAFYHPKGETKYSCENGGTHSLCETYERVYEDAYNNDDISSFIWDDDLKQGVINDEMEYNYFISSIAGAFALWMFISFGLDIGIRVGKLAFYEIISPIPVMMRVLPNDKMFDKWFKGIKDTFISLFIRLAVIFFCMYAITLVPDVLNGMWAENGDNVILLALANVLVILGILKFAQEAPKLIGDLFGGGGALDFSIGKKYKEAAKPLGRVADTARAGVYGATTAEAGFGNRFRGFFGGAGRGARYGYDQGTQRLDQARAAREDGSTLGGRMLDRTRRLAGMQSRADQADSNRAREIANIDNQLNDIARERDAMHIDTREANNSEVLGYRSNINDKIEKEAEKTNSKFRYSKSMSTPTYVDENGVEQKIVGDYATIQALYNSAQSNGVTSEELQKIEDYMKTRFYTDSNGNKVEITGDYQSVLAAQSEAVSNIPPKADGTDYTLAELEQLQQRAIANGASQDFIDQVTGAINATKALDNISYVDKNGTRHEISGNLSEIEQMYESALANGESAEVLSKLKSAKIAAKADIKEQILTAIMDGTAESKGIKTDVVADVNMNIDFINAMADQGRIAQMVDANGELVGTVTSHMSTANDILKGLESAVNEQKRQIERDTVELNRQKKDLEQQKQEIERQKHDETYRGQRADADAINRRNNNNNNNS